MSIFDSDQVRVAAAEGIATLSTTLEGQQSLKDTNVIRFMARMIGDGDPVSPLSHSFNQNRNWPELSFPQ